MAEHGSTAAISAVNRIRSGGLAGFFCKEEFEVIVDGSAPPTAGEAQAIAEDPSIDGAAPVRPPASARAPDSPEPEPEPVAVAVAEPILPARGSSEVREAREEAAPGRADPVVRPAPVFAAPTPPGADRPSAAFLALLERRLDDTSATEADLALLRARGAARRAPAVEPVAPSAVAPAPTVQTVRPATTVGQPAPLLSDEHARTSAFWLELQRAQHELASFMPLDSPFVAVLGPLDLTTAVVRRLRSGPQLGSAEVVVLTDRAGIVREPSWELVRSGHQLVDAAVRRARGVTGHPAFESASVLLIDVPVERPNWVAPLQNRLRTAGVGLFRHVIPGQPTVHDLEAHRQGSDVPYVIDLVSRVQPESVVRFIEDRHPIASVAGAELTAELLVALRKQVGRVR